MSQHLTVGALTVTALNDGDVYLPPSYYPGLPDSVTAAMAGPDGTYRIPIGCFLIRSPQATVLVDAGLGPYSYPFPVEVAAANNIALPPEHIASGGRLLAELAEAGIRPDEIDVVIITHLHADHIGGVADDDGLLFPNAIVYCNATDWAAPLVNPAPGEAEGRARLENAWASGAVTLLGEESIEVTPGVTALRIAGHTPGHTIVVVESEGSTAYLLGDAVHHPEQLVDPGVSFVLEDDPADALRAREWLFSALTDQGIPVGMTHLPGLRFQLIETGPDGRRRWRDA